MRCSSCKFDNPAGNTFCGACGQRLAEGCGQCGFENPPQFAFCGRCGHRLTATSPAATQPASPRTDTDTHRAERRHLTVLFCDLVDSTELAGRLDPEDLRALVRRYQAAVSRVIEHYRGHVAQYLGDGLLVYFGYPMAHEDDGHRALYSALEIVDAIKELNVRLQQTTDVQLAVRIGVHSGNVVTGDMGTQQRSERLAVGQTPNIAARLQAQAGANEIVLSAQTAEIVDGFFELERLGLKNLKGVSDPVQVFRLLRDTNIENRFQVTYQQGLSPFVGRERELSAIAGMIERVTAGRGEVLVLSGEPGIGKSRLIQHLLETTRNELRSVTLSCSPYHTNSDFYPVSTCLGRTIGLTAADDARTRLEKLEAYLDSRALERNEVVPYLAPILSLQPGAEYPQLPASAKLTKDRTFDVLTSLFFGDLNGRPLIFVAEDLHWVDPTTKEFLDFLILLAPIRPVLLLLTCRPEFESWRGSANITHIALQPLPREDVRALVDSMLDDTFIPDWLHQEIESRTDGVPIFIEELTKMVREMPADDLLRAERNGVLSQTIPTSLQDSLAARLDALGDCKDTLQLASVIGRTFSYDLLHLIWPDDEATLARYMHRLLRDGLLVPTQESNSAQFSFRHALIQDAAYESMLKARRTELHGKVATALLKTFPDLRERHPELIADHLTRAAQPEQALPLWLEAATRALRRSAMQEAINLFHQGIALIEAVPETMESKHIEQRLQDGLGTAIANTTHWGNPMVALAMERAEAICREIGNEKHRFSLMLKLQVSYTSQGRHIDAAKQASTVLEIASGWDDPSALARARAANVYPNWHLGRFADARAHGRAALVALAGLPDTEPVLTQRLYTNCYMSDAVWALGKADECQTIMDEGLMLCDHVQNPYARSLFLARGAAALVYLRNYSQLESNVAAAIALAEEHGFASILHWAKLLEGWRLAQTGDAAPGLATAEEHLKRYLRQGGGADIPLSYLLLAETQLKAHAPQAAIASVDEGLAKAHHHEEMCHHADLFRVRGEALRELGRKAEAAGDFNRALEIARQQGAPGWALRAALASARLQHSVGESTAARATLEPVFAQFTEGYQTADLVDAARLLRELAVVDA